MLLSVVLLSFFLLSGAFTLLSYRYVIQEKKESLSTNAQYIAEFTGDYLEQGNGIRDRYFRMYVASLAQISGAHVMLCETSGEIVYATDGNEFQQIEAPVPKAILNQVTRRGGYMGMTDLDGIYSESRFLTAEPIYGSQIGRAHV